MRTLVDSLWTLPRWLAGKARQCVLRKVHICVTVLLAVDMNIVCIIWARCSGILVTLKGSGVLICTKRCFMQITVSKPYPFQTGWCHNYLVKAGYITNESSYDRIKKGWVVLSQSSNKNQVHSSAFTFIRSRRLASSSILSDIIDYGYISRNVTYLL